MNHPERLVVPDLPSSPRFNMDPSAMDDAFYREPSQPTQLIATQPYLDPRRLGQSRSEDDLADVICYLSALTPGAAATIEDLGQRRPEFVEFKSRSAGFYERQKDLGESKRDGDAKEHGESNGHGIETNGPVASDSVALDAIDRGGKVLTAHGPRGQHASHLSEPSGARILSTDADDESVLRVDVEKHQRKPWRRIEPYSEDCPSIVLRFSAHLKDPCMGFVFGRNAGKVDILINDVEISNMHFRIFVKEGDILMLEDCSSNGTALDSHLIMRKTANHPDAHHRHMITHASIITIMTSTLDKKFVVDIPSRAGIEDAYAVNLDRYMASMAHARTERTQQMEALGAGGQRAAPWTARPLPPPVHIQHDLDRAQRPKPAEPSPYVLAGLPAGARIKDHGMHWNGGDVYNITGVLGKGAFATVYRAATKAEGELYAIKEISKRNIVKSGQAVEKIFNELTIMSRIDHPHIVKYFNYEDTHYDLYIIMEYVAHGDFRGQAALPDHEGRSVARQLGHALHYLHALGIAHRDIKPDNILIANRSPLIVKLTDFGLSKLTTEQTFLKTFCGTLLYCAPEVYPEFDRWLKRAPQAREPVKGSKKARVPYDFAVDIWSYGAVLFHLLSGFAPFEAGQIQNGTDMFFCIVNAQLDLMPLMEAGFDDDALDCISSMLRILPAERPSAEQCLQHPWLAQTEDVLEIPDLLRDPQHPMAGQEDAPDASQLSLTERRPLHIDDDADEVDEADVEGDLTAEANGHLGDSGLAVDVFDPAARAVASGDSMVQTALVNWALAPYQSKHQPAGGPPPNATTRPTRLFGEVGDSGVLGRPMHRDADDLSESENGRSDASHILPPRDGLGRPPPSAHPGIHHHSSLLDRHPRRIGSAPSLFGAEAQIGLLNMASSDSMDSAPLTPHTPPSRRTSLASSTLLHGSKRFADSEGSDETTPKRPKMVADGAASRSERLQGTSARWHGTLDSADQLDEGSHASLEGVANGHQAAQAAAPLAGLMFGEQLPSIGADGLRLCNREEIHMLDPGAPADSSMPTSKPPGRATMPAMATDGKTAPASADASNARPDTPTSSREATSPSDLSFHTQTHSQSRSHHGGTFLKPPTRLGKLIPLPGSVVDTPIKLEKQLTSFGREPQSDVVYPDPLDTRVPKAAIDILFWRPGMERETRRSAQTVPSSDETTAAVPATTTTTTTAATTAATTSTTAAIAPWTAPADAWAIVASRSSGRAGIAVNGVRLPYYEDERHGWIYGVLRHGDVVSIFEGPTGFLKYRCEFYVGLSRVPRRVGEEFRVEVEVEKYVQQKSVLQQSVQQPSKVDEKEGGRMEVEVSKEMEVGEEMKRGNEMEIMMDLETETRADKGMEKGVEKGVEMASGGMAAS